MTARQVFEATLIELSKVNAPTLKLYEFNYLFNKAINQYVNKIYNIYDINQQTTDDIRVLKTSAYLTPTQITNTGIQQSLQGTNSGNYEVLLPLDYLHILNCTCIYQVQKNISCYDQGEYVEIPATRLTADSWSNILTDVYNRPSPMKPYYYIHNINKQVEVPTNPIENSAGTDQIITNVYNLNKVQYKLNPDNTVTYSNIETNTDNSTKIDTAISNKVTSLNKTYDKLKYPLYYDGSLNLYILVENIKYYLCQTVDNQNNVLSYSFTNNKISTPDSSKLIQLVSTNNFNRTVTLKLNNNDINVSTVEKPGGLRYSNPVQVRCEIRYGKDNTVYELKQVSVDYIKSPQHIRLTQKQIDLTEDTSQIMEFPDYINQEIINELVHLVMERDSNPRLSNHLQITQSIARPTQQQTQQTT